MKKKKVVFFFLMIGIFSSAILILDWFFPSIPIDFMFGDKLLVMSITVVLLIYYLSIDEKPQLMPSILTTEKDNSKDRDKPDVTFRDVAGLEEIKEELQETIDFINNSQKYKRMGAKIPKGILFHGPPGTGKTLLAKAVAGETNSTFLYASGSEFVEKYVGVGAKRVRTLFEKAKKEAPSIIFIDEIDAIGTKRNSESNNEKDQTLNQLLVELDGFNTNETVIVIGATNRIDLLDEALLRPGRFDRHIYVGNPNVKARERILEVHTNNKPLDKSINIKEIAKKTTGLSGAQLANIANEAAIIAVRKNKNIISSLEFDAAIERVLAGLEVKNPTILLKEKNTVAFHEAGHALVSRVLNVDLVTEKELYYRITGLLAGRAAEKFKFKEITTGAKDDLNKATDIAREMVCSYGMSSLGTLALDEVYIRYNYDSIRQEIKKITDKAYNDALSIIEENNDILEHIAKTLLEHETIDKKELDSIYTKYKKFADLAT